MCLSRINKLKKSYFTSYEYILAVLASFLVFRKIGTVLIFIFVFFSIFYYKKLKFDKNKLFSIIIIAAPFFLDLFFLWNNDSFLEGFKHLEKRLSFIIFPMLIVGQSFSLKLKKILKIYSITFFSLLCILLARFIVKYPELIQKYLSGIDLWEMGYTFANSTSVHAPALNMHVSFLVVINSYLLVNYIIYEKGRVFNYRIILFVGSILILLIINTRLATVNAIIGIISVTLYELFLKKVSLKKAILIVSGTTLIFITLILGFAKVFPYITKKYTEVTFSHMDKIGRLDELDNPEGEVFNGLVTRLSIWKTAWNKSQEEILIGVGASDGKKELNKAYINTDQKFLAKYKFPTHNQYLDFLLKFGVIGVLSLLSFIFYSFWVGWKLKNSIALFFAYLCFTSNLTDDFFIRYDGITFFALWLSLFVNNYLNTPPCKYQSTI